MGDPPLIEPQTECTGTSTGTNQQTKRRCHQPSSPIIHRTKAIMRLSIQRRIPPKSGYETRQFARSIAQSDRTVFSQATCCSLALFVIDWSTDRLDCKFLPASCNVAAQRQEREEKDSFTVSLSCRRPREPGTSLHPRRNQRPSTINPNLIRLQLKRPFLSPRHTVRQEHSTLPETRIHTHTSALRETTAWPRCPCSNQGLLAIYLGARTDVTFASTHLQQRMASRAAALPSCKSRQHI